jgi:hypothetical protein
MIMINRNLTRRLEDLESRIQPVRGAPTILNVRFVDTDMKVVSEMQLTLGAPAAKAGKGRSSRRLRAL